MRTIAPNTPTFTPPQKEVLVMEVIRKQLIRGLLVFMLVSNVFLFLRFFLRLFGADPLNPFAAFIFMISGIFMLPFFGIFPADRDTIVAGEMIVDFSAFTAGFCYNVLIVLAMAVIQIGTSMLRTRRQEKESVKKGKPINTDPVDQTFSGTRP